MLSTVFGWNWGFHAHPVDHCVFGGLESAKLPLEPWMREAQAERTGENGKQWAAGKNWIITDLVLDICYFHPNFVNIIGVEEHISEELFNHQLFFPVVSQHLSKFLLPEEVWDDPILVNSFWFVDMGRWKNHHLVWGPKSAHVSLQKFFGLLKIYF